MGSCLGAWLVLSPLLLGSHRLAVAADADAAACFTSYDIPQACELMVMTHYMDDICVMTHCLHYTNDMPRKRICKQVSLGTQAIECIC